MANWWDQDEVVKPAPGPLTITVRKSPSAVAAEATSPSAVAPSGSAAGGDWWSGSGDEVVRAAPNSRAGGGIMEKLDAGVRGVADMATFGLSDELSAWLASKTGIGGTAGDYEGNLRTQRAVDKFDEENNFGARLTGQIAGGVGTGVGLAKAGLGVTAAGLPGRMAQGAAVGAGAGGVYGFGSGEGGPVERGLEAAKGAGIGAVAGPFVEAGISGGRGVYNRLFPRSVAAPSTLSEPEAAALAAAGFDPAQIGDDPARAILGRAQAFGGVTPATIRQAAAEEFAIPLTRGQATRDVGQAAFEEEARAAARGDASANILRGFDARQAEALASARQGMQREFAGAHPVVESVADVGQGIAGAVRDAERGLNSRVGQAYERAGQTGATISAEAIRGLPRRVGRVLDDAAVIVDDKLTPATQAALRELERIADVEGFAASRGVKLSPDASIAGVNLQGLEYVRRRINGLYGGNLSKADRMGLTTVKREFDSWLDDAVERTLISGDESALAALKEARALRAEYGRKFEKADRFDDSGGLIQRILRQDVTPGEVASMLYGLGRVGEQGRAHRLANDLQEVFGRDSEAWSAIRQGAWLRMTTAAEGARQPGPQATSQAILRFVNGTEGAATSRLLFSKEERETMIRFARTLQSLVPPERAANPSGSGFVLARRAESMAGKVAAMLGFAGTGSLTAAATAAGAVKAAATGGNLANAMRATMPVRVNPRTAPIAGIVGGEGGAAYGVPALPDFARR